MVVPFSSRSFVFYLFLCLLSSTFDIIDFKDEIFQGPYLRRKLLDCHELLWQISLYLSSLSSPLMSLSLLLLPLSPWFVIVIIIIGTTISNDRRCHYYHNSLLRFFTVVIIVFYLVVVFTNVLIFITTTLIVIIVHLIIVAITSSSSSSSSSSQLPSSIIISLSVKTILCYAKPSKVHKKERAGGRGVGHPRAHSTSVRRKRVRLF